MVLKLQGRIGHFAKGVQHGAVTGRFGLQHFPESFIAMFIDRVENLQSGEHHAGAMNGADVDGAKFAEEVGGEFRLGFGVLDCLSLFEVIFVAGLEPFGKALGSNTTARFAQSVDDGLVREAVIEHEVDHVAGWFGEEGDVRLQIADCRWWIGGSRIRGWVMESGFEEQRQIICGV